MYGCPLSCQHPSKHCLLFWNLEYGGHQAPHHAEYTFLLPPGFNVFTGNAHFLHFIEYSFHARH